MSCHENLIDLPAPPAPRVFRPNPALTHKLLVVGVVFLLGGCVAWWYWQQGQLPGRMGAMPFLLLPVGAVLTGLQLWNLVRPLRVALTAHGFSVNGEPMGWADVVAVGEQFNPTSRLNWLTAWVKTRNGRTVRLSAARLADLPELLAAIHFHTFDRLTAAARAAVGAGEIVRFGPIELASTGLRVKGRVIGWHELNQVWPDEAGDVGVWTADGRKVLDVATGKVDNLRVLLALVGEYAVPVDGSRGRR
jgi:hypothetical protein